MGRAILPDRDSQEEQKDQQIGSGTVLRWLRDNGRYLAPNGDYLLNGAILLRNWLSVQVVMTTLALTLFVFMQLFRNLLHWKLPAAHEPSSPACVAGVTSFASLESWLACYLPLGETHLWWSPWLLLPVSILAFAVVPLGCVYWLATDGNEEAGELLLAGSFILLLAGHLLGLAGAAPATALFGTWFITLLVLGHVQKASEFRNGDGAALKEPELHNWLSSKLKFALAAFGFLRGSGGRRHPRTDRVRGVAGA